MKEMDDKVAIINPDEVLITLGSGNSLHCRKPVKGDRLGLYSEEFHIKSKEAYGLLWVAVFTLKEGYNDHWKKQTPYIRLSDEAVWSWIATLIDEGWEITEAIR